MKRMLAIGIIAVLMCGVGLAGTAIASMQKNTDEESRGQVVNGGYLIYVDGQNPTAHAENRDVYVDADGEYVTIEIDWSYNDEWDWDTGTITFALDGPGNADDSESIVDRKGPDNSGNGELKGSFWATPNHNYGFTIRVDGKGKSAQDSGTMIVHQKP